MLEEKDTRVRRKVEKETRGRTGNRTKKVGIKDVRLIEMIVLLALAFMKMMSTQRQEMSCERIHAVYN